MNKTVIGLAALVSGLLQMHLSADASDTGSMSGMGKGKHSMSTMSTKGSQSASQTLGGQSEQMQPMQQKGASDQMTKKLKQSSRKRTKTMTVTLI